MATKIIDKDLYKIKTFTFIEHNYFIYQFIIFAYLYSVIITDLSNR